MVQIRDPTIAEEAPRSFQSSSWKGWEWSFHAVSCGTTSSYPWMTKGVSTAPGAWAGSVRVSLVMRSAYEVVGPEL